MYENDFDFDEYDEYAFNKYLPFEILSPEEQLEYGLGDKYHYCVIDGNMFNDYYAEALHNLAIPCYRIMDSIIEDYADNVADDPSNTEWEEKYEDLKYFGHNYKYLAQMLYSIKDHGKRIDYYN